MSKRKPKKAKVVVFPKKCPYCGSDMKTILKMYATWLECQNPMCRGQKFVGDDLVPFTAGHMRR